MRAQNRSKSRCGVAVHLRSLPAGRGNARLRAGGPLAQPHGRRSRAALTRLRLQFHADGAGDLLQVRKLALYRALRQAAAD